MKPYILLAIAFLGLSGCASIPKTDIGYYLPKAKSNIALTHAIACNSKNTRHSLVSGAVVSTKYESDLKRGKMLFNLDEIDGTFSSSDATFTLSEDGRLKGINTTTTGTGEEIVKGMITFGKTLAAFGLDADPVCDLVKTWGDNGVMSVTLNGSVSYNDSGITVDWVPEISSLTLYNVIQSSQPKLLPEVNASIESYSEVLAGPNVNDFVKNGDDFSMLKISRVFSAPLSVYYKNGENVQKITTTTVFVPMKAIGERLIPIPKAKFFGKSTLELALSDAGTVTSLRYGKESGGASSLGAISTIAEAIKGKSTADKAAEIQAKADLIAQTQRLASCEVAPKDCK